MRGSVAKKLRKRIYTIAERFKKLETDYQFNARKAYQSAKRAYKRGERRE